MYYAVTNPPTTKVASHLSNRALSNTEQLVRESYIEFHMVDIQGGVKEKCYINDFM